MIQTILDRSSWHTLIIWTLQWTTFAPNLHYWKNASLWWKAGRLCSIWITPPTPLVNVDPFQHHLTKKTCFNIEPGGEGEFLLTHVKVCQHFCPRLSPQATIDIISTNSKRCNFVTAQPISFKFWYYVSYIPENILHKEKHHLN